MVLVILSAFYRHIDLNRHAPPLVPAAGAPLGAAAAVVAAVAAAPVVGFVEGLGAVANIDDEAQHLHQEQGHDA
jgi:hypothetical protein